MKKTLLNLQLFAEDAAAAEGTADVAAEQENQPTDTKPETAANAKPELKYSDEDVDKLINKKFAEWESKKQKELEAEKAKADEAAKLAEMGAKEKAEHFLKKEQEAHAATQKELDEYKRKDTLSEMSKEARKMLAAESINISDELLSLIVTTDAEQTQTAVKSFAKLFNEAVENAAKEAAKGVTPKNITNNSDNLSEIEKRIAKYQ